MARSTFWKGLREGAGVFRQIVTGQPDGRTDAARNATPLQQAFGVAAVPTYPVTNRWEELGHDTSWNYVGIHTIGRQWGQADWVVYDEPKGVLKPKGILTKSHAADAPAEQRSAIHDHPQLDLLEYPNPMMGRIEFLYLICTHLRLTGEFCIWEVRNQEGMPCRYWPLPRSWMTYLPASEQYPMGLWQVRNLRGTTGYFGHSPLAGGFFLDARDVIIGKWPHPQYPSEGLSPMSACGRIIDIMEQMDLTVWSSLLNAYHNGMILLLDPKTTTILTEPQLDQMVSRFQSRKGGANQAGSVGVLQGVSKIERPSVPLSELNAVDVRKQNQEFGLGIQGVPSVASGMQNGEGTYAGNAATIMAFAEMGVQPDLDLFSSVLSRRGKLCGYWGGTWKLEGHAKRIDDPTIDLQRQDKYLTGWDKGIFTKNQVLAVFKEPPVPDGDQYKPEPPPPVAPLTQNFHGAGGSGASEGDPSAPPGSDDFDLDVDLPDDESTGVKRPELQAAAGNRMPFTANGKGH